LFGLFHDDLNEIICLKQPNSFF